LYYEIFSIIAPVFFCALVGFCWGKSGNQFDHRLISQLVFTVGVPCLIISKLGTLDISIDTLSNVALATLLILGLSSVLSYLFFKLSKISPQNFGLPLIFPNSGNMGLPLAYFCFGEQGLAVGLIVFSIIMLVHVTLGITYLNHQTSIARSLNTPLVYASIIAISMMFGGWELPNWASNTVDLLGEFPIPLMLITLGVSLAQLKVSDLPLSTLLSLARLVLGFSCGWIITLLLGITGYTQGVIILLSSMPVAVFNYLLAVQYQRAPEQVAGSVVLSTLISFLTLPWLIKFVIGL
jgi:predicted permease